jgi:Amt family ammonium transporter
MINPVLIPGAFTERRKFSAMLLYLTLWRCPSTTEGPRVRALGGRFPTLDFAGGTMAQSTSGVSALVCVLDLGKRLGYPKQAVPPHSVVVSIHWRLLTLWAGLAHAGSALAANGLGH